MKHWHGTMAVCLVALICVGCGGGRHASDPGATRGSAQITIQWPVAGRYIPASTQTVRLTIEKPASVTGDAAEIAQRISELRAIEVLDGTTPPPRTDTANGFTVDIARNNRLTTVITLNNLPVGRVAAINASALAADGTLLAEIPRTHEFSATPGANSFDMDMVSKIVTVEVQQVTPAGTTPNYIYNIGNTADFQVIARGAGGGMIPLHPDEVTWGGLSGVALTDNGLTATAEFRASIPVSSVNAIVARVRVDNSPESILSATTPGITVRALSVTSTAGNAVVGGNNPAAVGVEPDVAVNGNFVYVLRQASDGKVGIFQFNASDLSETEGPLGVFPKRIAGLDPAYRRITGHPEGLFAAQNPGVSPAPPTVTRFYDLSGGFILLDERPAAGSSGSSEEQFKTILDLATNTNPANPDRRTFLLNDVTNLVKLHRGDLSFVTKTVASLGPEPNRIAADNEGNVYVGRVDEPNRSITKVAPDNTPSVFLTIPTGGQMRDIACDGTFLYVLVIYSAPPRGAIYLYNLRDNRPEKGPVGSFEPTTGTDAVDMANAKSISVNSARTVYAVIRHPGSSVGASVKLIKVPF